VADSKAWPSQELIDSWLGQFHFSLEEGETPIPADDPAAAERARHFRNVLGAFATGVTVVTSMSDGEPVGMTAQSFSSVSLNPPLVLFCPTKTSRAWPMIHRSGHFCVNLLAEGQQDLSNTMARSGADKFAGVAWTPSKTGAPLLDGALGYVDCTIFAVHEAGDHYVVIGRVEDLDVTDQENPLLFYKGSYRSLSD
jgi:3-hydroxy-9,10-secoandrosta-1,3,5(10)-triene-9,17-dione monooxygenase reductase component